MCVCMCSAEDVQSIVTGKLALKYTGVQIEAIQSIARASQNRSIAEFEKVRSPHIEREGGGGRGRVGRELLVVFIVDCDRTEAVCAG